jgi:signal peptidase II
MGVSCLAEEEVLKKVWKDYGLIGAVAGLIVLLDQWTKHIIRTQLAFNEIWMPWEWLAPYARIVHWRNTGAAFGIGQDLNLVFTVLSLIVIAGILYYFPQIPRSERFFRVALSMQMGGALGNLIDRVRIGHVTDFISVGRFPVFNVADSSITLGVVVLLLGLWLEDHGLQENEEDDE